MDVVLNGRTVRMEVDTGAAVTIVDKKIWEDIGRPKLSSSKIRLKDFSGSFIELLGSCEIDIKYENQNLTKVLYVVKGNGPSLLGRNWLIDLQVNWKKFFSNSSVNALSEKVFLNEVLNEYKNIFSEGLGTIKGIKADLNLDCNATPKFYKPRPVPYALKDKIESEIKRLVSLGVIEPVKHADWAAPIVPVLKASGDVRLCGDFKVTVNPHIKMEEYPIPKVEDLFVSLEGGRTFSTLDLSEAYLQLELKENSKSFMVINTHLGLFKYNRLCFGINTAPTIFQKTMDTILQGLPGVICYLDDVLVTGKTKSEHLANLKSVLERFSKFGIKLRLKKCKFMENSVEYLGHVIDEQGLHVSQRKIDAVRNMPAPTNVSELRALLGLINYYAKFLPNLSHFCRPFYNLLQKDHKFEWSEECKRNFDEIKATLSNAPVLCHYDQNLELGLACDASSVGIGAVLFHIFPDGTEKPIYYASKTLSKTEKNYSQIEKEGLAIIFGVKKFHQFIFGRKFYLYTDHKPLLTIFSPTKGISSTTANRIQRWALLLSGYNYTIIYKNTKNHANADSFSRLPVKEECSKFDDDRKYVDRILSSTFSNVPLNSEDISSATEKDEILRKVFRFCKNGWPAKCGEILKIFKLKQGEISIFKECLFWGKRIVIPTLLRTRVLRFLHESHLGIVKMKSLARQYVWWPNIDADIEAIVRKCTYCSLSQQMPPKTVSDWTRSSEVWERVHIDFAGPFKGFMWLILVDSASKWLEVVPMKQVTAKNTIECLFSIFAKFGYPTYLVSDNGPQLRSLEMGEFCKMHGITQKFSAPYHPNSNGEAEINVKTFKNAIKNSSDSDLFNVVSKFLMQYRNTPHCTTKVCPSDVMFRRKIRTSLSQLNPLWNKIECDELIAEKSNNCTPDVKRNFSPGEAVWVRAYGGSLKWAPGRVTARRGNVMYDVQLGDRSASRHVDQLRPRVAESSENSDDSYLYFEPHEDSERSSTERREQTPSEPRYPARQRRPPVRYPDEYPSARDRT